MRSLKLPSHIKKNRVWVQLFTLPYFTVASGLIMNSGAVFAEEYFNPSFLSNDAANVADLSRFAKGEGQPAGIYRVDIYLNDQYVGTQDMKFDALKSAPSHSGDDTGLSPCLTRDWLDKQNVNIAIIPALNKLPAEQCSNLPAALEKAETRFDFDRQRLDISIPQAALKNNIRGYIPPEQWDEGINAGLLNYSFSGSNSLGSTNNRYNSYFLNLGSGLNLGPWRLRNNSSWNYSESGRYRNSDWQNVSTYIQRTIIPLKSSLTIGDGFTPGDVFDSLGFRGVQIASDDNMLPDSMRGFAPTVRGLRTAMLRSPLGKMVM